ncbi:MAG: DASS family sodium-coupled anion symporter [Alphaproteobacteria bacterium]|nr:DASS family sodium-coupled anion symporter [Alphaproteobacteria bacterium]
MAISQALNKKPGLLDEPSAWQGAKPVPFMAIMTLGLALWMMPVPEGLSLQTWHLFTIFVTTVVALIVQPLPVGAISIIVIVACVATHTLTIEKALGSYSNKIIWLIFAAICVARGFIKTGLGSRIAYIFIGALGKSTLGLSYGLIGTELLLAPFVPSNTARGAGIIFPIATSLADQYDSSAEKGTEKRIGGYLITLIYQTNVITSTMFLTAMAANPLIASIAGQSGAPISWMTWATASVVPGLVCLLLLPLTLYIIYPPELKQTPSAPITAKQKLAEMGDMSLQEKLMLGTFGLLLGLWVFGEHINVDAASAAFIGLGILLLFGILTWDDILKEHTAWNTMFWLAVLLMLAHNLTELGMMDWFSQHMQNMVSSYGWIAALSILGLVYFYSHYFFASMTAHVSAMYGAFALVAIAAGAPPMLTCLFLAPLSTLSAGLTHYGTGTAPVYHASGLVKTADWWRTGFIISVINITVWATVGVTWWKFMGYW